MVNEIIGQSLPPLFVVKHNIVIGTDFIDPIYKHLGHEGYPFLFMKERERFMAVNGIMLQNLEKEYGIRAFVSKLNVTYNAPVMEGDQVTLETSLTMPKPFAIDFQHLILKEGVTVTEANCLYIILNLNNRPNRIPNNLVQLLKQVKKTE